MARALAFVAALSLLLVPAAYAAFPGENGKIAFVRGQSVWTMNADGTGQTQLTSSPSYDRTPAWSPDGTTIAFSRYTPSPYQVDILSIRADGTQEQNLTNSDNPEFDIPNFFPTWSPDGSRIAFDGHVGFCIVGSCSPESDELFVMNSDGSGRAKVTEYNGFDEEYLDWSPDGSKIVFADEGNLYTVQPDGTGVTQLTDVGTDWMPSWSPDGSKIAFATSRDETGTNCGSACNFNIYIANADGSGAVRLTDDPDRDVWPAWSPDGTKIAFTRQFCGASSCTTSEIHMMNADGSGEVGLTAGAMDSTPDWQPVSNRAPDCSGVSASPSALRPPNNRLIKVATTGATDPDGDAVEIEITGVTQDERVGRRPDARPGTAASEVLLRAQRRPRGDGRVYRIALTASDGRGGECSGTAKVEVRRHRKQPAVDSAPPSYDSFTPSSAP